MLRVPDMRGSRLLLLVLVGYFATFAVSVAFAQTSPPATTADVQAVAAAVESVRVLALSFAVCVMFALGVMTGNAP